MIKLTQIFFFIFFCLTVNAQVISNVHFEQVGKQIHIYYDLVGEETYDLDVYCSEDNGNSWGDQLVFVKGAVGEMQKPGVEKLIVWDVLEERENLKGDIIFRIKVFPSSFNGTSGNFIDKRDNKKYLWVRFGKQLWMAENLSYKIDKSCWTYNYKERNADLYGRLYNWNAAMKSCPPGWHLPSDEEWKYLIDFLGGSNAAGSKLKDIINWNGPFTKKSKIIGFNALPGGIRDNKGAFQQLEQSGVWWSSSEATSNNNAWRRMLSRGYEHIYRGVPTEKTNAYSVRCVMD